MFRTAWSFEWYHCLINTTASVLVNCPDRCSKTFVTLPRWSYHLILVVLSTTNVELSTNCRYLQNSIKLPLEIQFEIGP